MTDTQNIEVRLADMAGEIKAMGIEVRNLVTLVEKDVSVLRKDHEHLKENHKALDQATALMFDKLCDRIAASEAEAEERYATKESLRPIWWCGSLIALIVVAGVLGKIMTLLGLPIGVA